MADAVRNPYVLRDIEAGHAIQQAVAGINLDDFCNSRLIRSSVEREFTIIGEALKQLSQRDEDRFAQIDQAPQIISVRNKLTHESPSSTTDWSGASSRTTCLLFSSSATPGAATARARSTTSPTSPSSAAAPTAASATNHRLITSPS
ncbi:MAG: DUF86 domain-containing protein [Cyanobacteriota bacterium]